MVCVGLKKKKHRVQLWIDSTKKARGRRGAELSAATETERATRRPPLRRRPSLPPLSFSPDIWIGAVPFPSDVPLLKSLGITGVVTLTERFETLVESSIYEQHGIKHLWIPTTDYVFAPSVSNIHEALEFIHKHATKGGSTLVHCKAGRARSATIVLCYLVQYKNMTPEAALDRSKSIRKRVKLATAQWQAVKAFSSNLVDVGKGAA